MLINYRPLSICLFSLALFACKSTSPPEWYSAPPTNEPDYLVSVGQGRSLEQAKKTALNQINALLWTQIDSTFASRDVYQSRGSNSTSNSLVDNKINSRTATVSFTDIEYPLIDKNDIGYYVQAKVKRESVINQLQMDIRQTNARAEQQIQKLQHQDSLVWWLENRELTSQLELIYVRQAMLKSMSVDDIPTALSLNKLISKVSEIQSNLIIRFINSKSDQKSAELLADQFSMERLKTTSKSSSQVTHILRMDTELRQSRVGDAYVSTQLTTLKLQGHKGNTLASNEIISSGNSLSNYALSKEGAQRHFSEIVGKQGLWNSLGIK
ncbi:LPP20 family lipoprotein [Vibrio diazotrophicus]|uniref:LPP20 family lipoprotein n=1 Tax=Vibrio diazotrophicus TaxID=685 RepID=UPI000C9EAFD0|nr:LPP20 family lipoprotein [Vibrio diazotrophicus]PNH80565.1 hypothetical protein C1N27_09065 [Vibrio diazotrophicus]